MNPQTTEPDPIFSRICETSTRLMGGAVNRSTMKKLQKLVRADGDSYPWEEVVDRVLAEEMAPAELTKTALKSQRDWVVRGGRQTPGKSVRHHAKSLLAKVLAKLIFMVILMACIIVLLVLCKLRWPEIDIYAANEWLAEAWPSGFGTR